MTVTGSSGPRRDVGWRQGLAALRDFFVPAACLCCGDAVVAEPDRKPVLVCPRCLIALRSPAPPYCNRCGAPAGTGRVGVSSCAECIYWPKLNHFRARSACRLEGATVALVHALKYGGWSELGALMAERMVRMGPMVGRGTVPLVVPVPTTPQRVRDRGYNQAAILALAYARQTGLQVVQALVREDASPSQVALQPQERAANVRGAFELARGPVGSGAARILDGAHVLLIDDVLTTGATVSTAAAKLLESGAAEVIAVTFARALSAGSGSLTH